MSPYAHIEALDDIAAAIAIILNVALEERASGSLRECLIQIRAAIVVARERLGGLQRNAEAKKSWQRRITERAEVQALKAAATRLGPDTAPCFSCATRCSADVAKNGGVPDGMDWREIIGQLTLTDAEIEAAGRSIAPAPVCADEISDLSTSTPYLQLTRAERHLRDALPIVDEMVSRSSDACLRQALEGLRQARAALVRILVLAIRRRCQR